jgi:hypothetical protein
MRFAGGAGAISGVRGRFVGTAAALIAFGEVDFTLSN